jgi:hypothetical protein
MKTSWVTFARPASRGALSNFHYLAFFMLTLVNAKITIIIAKTAGLKTDVSNKEWTVK